MMACRNHGAPSTSAEARARLREPLAASTAAVELVSATVPAARSSINRVTASANSPPDWRFSRRLPRPHQIAPPRRTLYGDNSDSAPELRSAFGVAV